MPVAWAACRSTKLPRSPRTVAHPRAARRAISIFEPTLRERPISASTSTTPARGLASYKGESMNILTLLLIIAVLVILFGNPHVGGRVYPGYAAGGWGYWPSGLGLIILIVVLLMLFGR